MAFKNGRFNMGLACNGRATNHLTFVHETIAAGTNCWEQTVLGVDVKMRSFLRPSTLGTCWGNDDRAVPGPRGEVFSAGLTTVERTGSGWMVYHSAYERLARAMIYFRARGSDCYLEFREDVAMKEMGSSTRVMRSGFTSAGRE